MARYAGDPYWMTLKYAGVCASKSCGATLCKGTRAFRYKNGALYGAECGCGERESRSFESAAADEDTYNGCGNAY